MSSSVRVFNGWTRGGGPATASSDCFCFFLCTVDFQTGYWCNCVWLHCPLLLSSVLMQSFAQCAGSNAIGFHFVGAMSSCSSPRRGRFSEGFLLGFRERFLFVEYSPVGLKPVFHGMLSHGSKAQEGGRFSLPNLLDFVVSCATSTLGCAPAPRKASA